MVLDELRSKSATSDILQRRKAKRRSIGFNGFALALRKPLKDSLLCHPYLCLPHTTVQIQFSLQSKFKNGESLWSGIELSLSRNLNINHRIIKKMLSLNMYIGTVDNIITDLIKFRGHAANLSQTNHIIIKITFKNKMTLQVNWQSDLISYTIVGTLVT